MTTTETKTNTNINCHACYHDKIIHKCYDWFDEDDNCPVCIDDKITYYKIPCDEGCIYKELRNTIHSLLEKQIMMRKEYYGIIRKIYDMEQEYIKKIYNIKYWDL